MRTIIIHYAVFDNGNRRCDNEVALQNVFSGRVHPEKIEYTKSFNGPHDIPWGEQDCGNVPLHILKEEMNSLPQTCTGEAWTGKFMSIRITL